MEARAMSEASSNLIVVGIDGSEGSDAALRWAVDEALRSHRELLVVCAWHWSADAVASPFALVGAPESMSAGRRLLEHAATLARRHHVEVGTKLVEGSAKTALVKVADGAAMLVVGSHGRRAVTRALIGSTGRACVQHATCPVVVVPRTRVGAGRRAGSTAAVQPV
jgi:nucleotide-binding universal stress UspA family protein